MLFIFWPCAEKLVRVLRWADTLEVAGPVVHRVKNKVGPGRGASAAHAAAPDMLGTVGGRHGGGGNVLAGQLLAAATLEAGHVRLWGLLKVHPDSVCCLDRVAGLEKRARHVAVGCLEGVGTHQGVKHLLLGGGESLGHPGAQCAIASSLKKMKCAGEKVPT